MNAYLLGFLVVLAASAISVGGMLIVRKTVGVDKLSSFNDVAGNCFQVVGTFYAVLLGLIVVDAMSSMSDLRVTVDKEANAVCDTYILARGLPDQDRARIQGLCTHYVDVVLQEEWPAMRDGKVSREGILCVSEMWDSLIDVKPTTDGEKDIRQMCLTNMSQLGDNRRARLIASQHGVDPEIWAVLIIGAILTVAFSYFLCLPSMIAQVLMTVVISTTLSLNVYLVYLYGYPLSGPYAIFPEGFMVDRMIFNMKSSGKAFLPEEKTFSPKKLFEHKR